MTSLSGTNSLDRVLSSCSHIVPRAINSSYLNSRKHKQFDEKDRIKLKFNKFIANVIISIK